MGKYLVIINLFTLFLMYFDKRLALYNRYRISESILLMFSIIGGSIGTLIGIYFFRHKTKKRKFICGIPLIILFQIFIILIEIL